MLAWPLSLHAWSPSAPLPQGTLPKATRFPGSLFSRLLPLPVLTSVMALKVQDLNSVYDLYPFVPRPRATPALICVSIPGIVHRVGRGSIKFFELVNKCLTATRDLCPKSSHSSTPGPVYTSKPLTHPEIGIPEEFPHSFFLPPSSFHFKIRTPKVWALGSDLPAHWLWAPNCPLFPGSLSFYVSEMGRQHPGLLRGFSGGVWLCKSPAWGGFHQT